ncbi:MAG: crossover junction endodeoxyribonuclease RuvC [Pseudomonadales bacterium]|jgi:crossover junction endodeoxyribonuclease RuvC|nr:crossover junction endodeoxyribonuclease RuvC [Pseudomonadales bacterium]
MTIVLGIDPGSRITGYGLVAVEGTRHRYVASGCIRTGDGALPERLGRIQAGLADVIREHAPAEAAVEKVFVYRSADSALKLGQARGAAVLTAVMAGLVIAEYAAPKVKQALTGTGAANKEQVAHMVRVMLGIRGELQADAADALAIAICHLHTRSSLARLGSASGFRRSRLQG